MDGGVIACRSHTEGASGQNGSGRGGVGARGGREKTPYRLVAPAANALELGEA